MCRRCVEPWSSSDDGVKKRRYASEQETPRVQQLRHEYRRWLDRVDIHNLVFVDQAGVNRSMTGLYAPAMGGERAIDAVPRNAGENISLIGALSVDGLIAGMRQTTRVVFQEILAIGPTTKVAIATIWPGTMAIAAGDMTTAQVTAGATPIATGTIAFRTRTAANAVMTG